MPWHIGRSAKCPASKPHAVIKDADGSVAGCHMTVEEAKKQLAALYASEPKGQSVKHKTFEVETKTEGEAGQFTALASVFGNVDHVGDRVMPGAFAKTLEWWRGTGKPMPIILSHQWEDPFATIGKADPRAVIETDEGLLVQGQLDITDNHKAKQVHKLMKEGLLTGWSFGYTVPDGGEQPGEDGANELTEIDLVEVGPTLKGANSEAQLQSVKSLDEALAVVTGEAELEDSPEIENAESEKSVPPAEHAANDPLRKRCDEIAYALQAKDLDLRDIPEPAPPAKPELPVEELRRRSREAEFELLVGSEDQ